MKFSNFRNVVKVCEEFLDGEGWCIIILKRKAGKDVLFQFMRENDQIVKSEKKVFRCKICVYRNSTNDNLRFLLHQLSKEKNS